MVLLLSLRNSLLKFSDLSLIAKRSVKTIFIWFWLQVWFFILFFIKFYIADNNWFLTNNWHIFKILYFFILFNWFLFTFTFFAFFFRILLFLDELFHLLSSLSLTFFMLSFFRNKVKIALIFLLLFCVDILCNFFLRLIRSQFWLFLIFFLKLLWWFLSSHFSFF